MYNDEVLSAADGFQVLFVLNSEYGGGIGSWGWSSLSLPAVLCYHAGMHVVIERKHDEGTGP